MRDEELDGMNRQALLLQYKQHQKKNKILVKKTNLCGLKRRDTGKACSIPLSR